MLDGTGTSAFALNVKSDAIWVGTKSVDTRELAPTEGDVTRLRVIIEGERACDMGAGATLTPSGEVGLCHDGGDAETGTGLEVGALVAHEESGYEEWGASGAIRGSTEDCCLVPS